MAVLLASAGFLLTSVISDIKHSLFTLILIVMSYHIYLFGVKKGIVSSQPEISILEATNAEQRS